MRKIEKINYQLNKNERGYIPIKPELQNYIQSFYISNDRYYGGKNGMKQSGYLILNDWTQIPIMIKYSNKVKKSYVSMSNYNNSALSEYLASCIINMFDLSIKAHPTWFFDDAPKQCVACVDFTFDTNDFKKQYKFYTLHEIMNAYYENTNDFYNVLEVFKELDYEKEFYELFLIDALLANGDRHSNNIGFLIIDNQKVLSPIYDNAASLFPNSTIEYILNKDKQFKRNNEYPKSALTINNKRIDYKKFIKSNKDLVFLSVLKEFKNKYHQNINLIKDFINECYFINQRQKDFYIDLIKARFNNIINQPELTPKRR